MESSYAACMGRPTQRVELVAGEREALEGLRKRQRSARSLAFRAGIILGCATGVTDKEVARQLRTTSWTVGFWRQRFNRGRLEALSDEPRVGAPRSISDERVEEVITTTLESMPQNATHWSSRALAQRLGMSQSSISRIWRAFGLQPHRRKSFSSFAGSPTHRKGSCHRGPLHGTAGQRREALRRREESDSGSSTQPTSLADAPGTSGEAHS